MDYIFVFFWDFALLKFVQLLLELDFSTHLVLRLGLHLALQQLCLAELVRVFGGR